MRPQELQLPLRRFFRKRRFRNFQAAYRDCKTILDIGGEPGLWEIIGQQDGVVLLNSSFPGENEFGPTETGGLPYLVSSGLGLPFASGAFDLAFSNSVIEHVGSEANQFQFAREMMRVGKRVYCQTPSRLFPVDPHLTMPFLHWLPRKWLTPKFLRYFTLNGWLFQKPYEYEVTWISKKKLQKMFPGCQITTERFLGLPKSFTVSS